MSLSQLMQMAPTMGGFMVGQQNNSQLQNDAMRRMEIADLMNNRQQELQMKQQMHPLEMQMKQASMRRSEAELPGILADIEAKQLKNTFTKATQQGDIEAHQGDQFAKFYDRFSKQMGQFGRDMESVSDVDRPAWVMQRMKEQGFPDHFSKELLKRFESQPTSNWSRSFQDYERQMIENAPDTVKARLKATQDHKDKLAEIGAQGTEQRKTEQMRIDAGKYQRKQQVQGFTADVERRLLKATNPVQQLTVLTDAAAIAHQAGELELAANFTMRANQIRGVAQDYLKRDPQGGTPDLGGMGIPTNPGPQLTVPPLPVTGGPQPSAAPRPQAPAMQQPTNGLPKPGEVRRGYRYKGGDPSKQENWVKV